MTRNLGATRLRRKRRSGDPMRKYDALPQPLRHWLSQAALPWSPTSARRLWMRACARGLDTQGALQALSRAEERTLARGRRLTRLLIHQTPGQVKACDHVDGRRRPPGRQCT